MITGIQAGARTRWEIDPSHSLVEFGVKHMMFTTVKGRFMEVSGEILADEDDTANSSVEVEIATASIDTRSEQRDAHLRSLDFFDAETYPAITFQSTRVEPVSAERLMIVGDLTIRGVTREVRLSTTLNGRGVNPFGQEVAGFTAETKIDRKEFGLTWNAALEAGGMLVGDDVNILLEIQAARQS